MDKDNLLKFQIARLKVDIKNVSNIYFPWHCNETFRSITRSEMDVKVPTERIKIIGNVSVKD